MRRNVADIARISVYSRECLRQLRADTSIQYQELQRGIMHFYTDREDFEGAAASAPLLREYGIEREVKTVDEAIAIEPALASARERIAGVTYMPDDESGDAHLFTRRLAELAAAKGCRFEYGKAIDGIDVAGGRVSGVRAGGAPLVADAYVVALGSYSPMATRPIGFGLPVYPAKGYSATVPIRDPAKAPQVSLTDEGAKIVLTRLGDRLRIAGTAELSGYSTELNRVRCEALVKRAALLFPEAGDYGEAVFWTGLRPSTPSNVPIIGRSRYPNLYLNTGHGTLGWTMAAGSGRALADIISGRKPEVEFRWSS